MSHFCLSTHVRRTPFPSFLGGGWCFHSDHVRFTSPKKYKNPRCLAAMGEPGTAILSLFWTISRAFQVYMSQRALCDVLNEVCGLFGCSGADRACNPMMWPIWGSCRPPTPSRRLVPCRPVYRYDSSIYFCQNNASIQGTGAVWGCAVPSS